MTFWSWLQRIWRRGKPEQRHVDFWFDSGELTLSIDEFAHRYLDPAIETLAAQIAAKIQEDEEWRPAPWHKRASLWLSSQWSCLWSWLPRREAQAGRIGSSLRIRMPEQFTVHSEEQPTPPP